MATQSFGKALPLDDPKGGRNWKEFSGEKLDPQVKIEVNDLDGMAIIAKNNKIASEIIDYNLERLYKRKEDGSIAFFYSFKGDFDNCTIEEINLVSELLQASFNNDYETYFQDFNPQMNKALQVKVNFERQMIYLFYELKFEKEWKANDKFKEIQ